MSEAFTNPPISLSPRLAFTLMLASCVGIGGCTDNSLELAGVVDRTAIELAAPISEVIVGLEVEVGQRVDAGTVVVRLDDAVAVAELRASEAGLAAAHASLVEGEGEFARQEKLRTARVATKQALDVARRARDEALALVAEREARIAQAEKKLEDLSIRAHTSGVVDQLPYQAGERVPAGGVVAVVVADESPWVRAWLPARAIARLAPNHAAKVKVEGFDSWFEAKVNRIGREAEFTPHYALTEREGAHLVFESRLTLIDAPADLRPGLPARIRVELGPEP